MSDLPDSESAVVDAMDISGLPSRLRLISVFESWWEELDAVLYSDSARAARCLHHLARILEDAGTVGDKKKTPAVHGAAEEEEEDEEREMLSVRLIRIVVNEFGDVADSMFRQMTSATDTAFLRAGMRFLVAYKQACWRNHDDFYILYPADLLEAFLMENANSDDVVFAARLAYLGGDLIDETDAQSPVPPQELVQLVIQRFKDSTTALQSRVPEIIEFAAELSHKLEYIENSAIPIPLPSTLSPTPLEWEADEGSDPQSIAHALTLTIGNLRLLAAMADITETLHPSVEAGMVQICLDLLRLPHFSLTLYSLGWFSAALVHKKIAMEFVEARSIPRLQEFVAQYRSDAKRFALFAPYISYILVALSKHSVAMETLLGSDDQSSDNNTDTANNANTTTSPTAPTTTESTAAAAAENLFDFALDMMQDDNVDTQLNIVEWIGEAFNFPVLLRLCCRRNVLSLLRDKLLFSLSVPSDLGRDEEKMLSLRGALRRETVRSLLRFVSVQLFWGVQYSLSVSASSLLETTRTTNNKNGLSLSAKRFFSWTTLPTTAKTHTTTNAHNDQQDEDQQRWDLSATVRVSDDDLVQLEAYVHQSLIKTGSLPAGLSLSLFGSPSSSFASPLTTGDVEAEAEGESAERDLSHLLHSHAHVHTRSAADDALSVTSSMRKASCEWIVAQWFTQQGLVPALLKALIEDNKDSSMVLMLLLILELLCLDAGAVVEIQCAQPSEIPRSEEDEEHPFEPNPLQKKKGLEILLATITNPARRDPQVIASTLRVLSAMCTPPQFRYKGTNLQTAMSILEDFVSTSCAPSHNATAANATTLTTKKRFDPNATMKKVYVFSRDLHSPLADVQKSVRTAIRSFSGINSLMQLIYYKKNQQFVVSVRLETVRVLLGMAQDQEIKLILSKMRIPTILENQVRVETSQMHLLELSAAPVSKSNERPVLEFYCDVLGSLLNDSGDAAITERSLDATQDALERKAIVDRSNIEFHDSELMQLIKEHLVSKGLHKTVAMMENEMSSDNHALPVENTRSTLPTIPECRTPFPEGQRKRSLDVTTAASVEAGNVPVAGPALEAASTRKIKRMNSHEIEQLSSSSAVHTAESFPVQDVPPVGQMSVVPISKAQRKRNLRRALQQPTHAIAATAPSLAAPSSASAARTTDHLLSPHANQHKHRAAAHHTTQYPHKPPAQQSKLHQIMHRYLKIQHAQCKHPITTLPVLSLQRPHVCAKPPPCAFNNIVNLVHRQSAVRDSWHHTHYKHDFVSQRIQYLYSSYRPVRSVRQIEGSSSLSAAAFASDPARMWVAFHQDWSQDGPGVALVDIPTDSEISLQGVDLPGIISKFTLSPRNATVSPMMLTAVTDFHAYHRYEVAHELYLWKDNNDLEVFNHPPLRHFQVSLNNETAPMENDDFRETVLFSAEAFHPSGRSIVALDCPGGSSSLCSTAYLLDIETGAVMQTIRNDGSENTYEMPSVQFLERDENLLLMDGKLWDVRQSHSTVIHRFDKLSFAGYTAEHPFKPEIIIDNAIWDLRNYSVLRQTVPLLEGCKVKFDAAQNALFAYHCLDEERENLRHNLNAHVEDNTFFHVLHATDYAHIHTEVLDRERMLLWDLDVDRQGAGYVSTLMSTHEESLCRVFEVGKRRRALGGADSDDDDDDGEGDELDDDWDSQGEDDDDDMHTHSVSDEDDEDSMETESDADDDIDDSSMADSDEEDFDSDEGEFEDENSDDDEDMDTASEGDDEDNRERQGEEMDDDGDGEDDENDDGMGTRHRVLVRSPQSGALRTPRRRRRLPLRVLARRTPQEDENAEEDEEGE